MDEDLGSLLTDPFQAPPARAAKVGARIDDSVFDLAETGRSVRDHSIFKGAIENVLRPHVAAAEELHQRFHAPTLPPSTKTLIDQHAARLKSYVDDIKKKYRIYVETAADETLEKEARRLERRFFNGPANARQIEFLKLKRYYEKIRTFQEFARLDWRELHKFVDTLGLLPETRMLARQAELELLKGVHLLLRQTDSFLDALKIALRADDEEKDAVTGTYKVTTAYNPSVRYTIAAVLGEESPEVDLRAETPAEVPQGEGERRDVEGSIAKNIVLETRERRLNSASILSVPLRGSRDWNRSPQYAFEVPVKYYDECVENFNKSYHVNLKEDILAAPLPSAAALVRSGAGQIQFAEYVQAIHDALEEIANDVLKTDFPGTEKPLVFLYHCGPNAFYSMLVYVLRQRKQGEIFYVDSTNNTIREYPDELIRKSLIDWWTAKFEHLSGEDVDSYLTYSRSVEMVKKDYRLMQEKGMQQLKREQPQARYAEREKWLKENHARVFGIRKLEIFKRFLTGTVF